MAKKEYRVEINNVTAEVLTALEGANSSFKLYEVNEVKAGSGDFANGANFHFKELLLNPVAEMDTTDYDEQLLQNHCAELQKNMPHVMTKEVRL